MREDIDIYVNDIVENIQTKSGVELNNYLIDLFEIIANNDTIDISEEKYIDNDGVENKLELLEAIYEEIKSEEDKILFAQAVSENTSLFDSKIIDEFTKKVKDKIKNEIKDEEEIEELEEEAALDTPPTDMDTDSSSEENVEEENKEEEKTPELPEITAYKLETEKLEKELEELLEKVKDIPREEGKELSEMDDILEKTTYPEIETNDNKQNEVKEELENIEKELKDQTELKERYENLKSEYDKFYDEHNIPKTNDDYRQKMDIYNKRIKDCNDLIKTLSEKKLNKETELQMLITKNDEISGPLFRIEVWKFAELYNKEVEKLENNLKELNEIQDKYYKESISVPVGIYGMKTKLENQIKEMRETFTKTIGIRSEINLNNPEFKPVLDAVRNGRKVNNEINEELDKDYRPEKKENGLEDEELKNYIEKLKEEIGKRRENIAKYEDALKDIREIERDIKSGKKPEDEEIKNKVENVKNKINTITDDKLKEELTNELNRVLGLKKDPDVPTDVKKDPNKWKKWLSGIAGLAVGAGVIALTPLGLGGAMALSAGAQVVKKVINKKHEKLKHENEITNIEKTGKLAKFKEKIKTWLKDENIVKNINWALNGFTIGALTTGAIEQIVNMTSVTQLDNGIADAPKQEPVKDPYSNIKIGDNASGLNLSTGYDQANWATQNINPEALHQGIMNDGNSMIDGFGIVKDSGIEVVETAGQSLTEVAKQYGVPVEDIALKITNQSGAGRAWVNVAEAAKEAANVGRTL